MRLGLILSLCIALATRVSAHGWVTSPVSKNEMEWHHFQYHPQMPSDFQYEPQTSNHGNGIGEKAMGGGYSCGAQNASTTYGLSLWQQWYDAAALPVTYIKKGGKMSTVWSIPEDFSCPAGYGVARWLWKT